MCFFELCGGILCVYCNAESVLGDEVFWLTFFVYSVTDVFDCVVKRNVLCSYCIDIYGSVLLLFSVIGAVAVMFGLLFVMVVCTVVSGSAGMADGVSVGGVY